MNTRLYLCYGDVLLVIVLILMVVYGFAFTFRWLRTCVNRIVRCCINSVKGFAWLLIAGFVIVLTFMFCKLDTGFDKGSVMLLVAL